MKEAKPLTKERMTYQDIPLIFLVPHPENSNFMNAETAKKLRRHIERTGRYEPLTVRPHPKEEGKFQLSTATIGYEFFVLSITRPRIASSGIWMMTRLGYIWLHLTASPVVMCLSVGQHF